MNNYIDIYGRYHDKPVTDSNPVPSNNGWIYTAYAEKAYLGLDWFTLGVGFKACRIQNLHYGYSLIRSPGKTTPPISRDEILGMAALGFLKPQHLNKWNYSPYEIPKFNTIEFVKQLWQLRPSITISRSESFPGIPALLLGLDFKHRNHFWENNLDQLYRFAFKVPLSDRHFILKKWGIFKLYNPVHLFYAAFGKLQSLRKPNAIDWLKYDGKGSDHLKKEFPVDHPVRIKLGLV